MQVMALCNTGVPVKRDNGIHHSTIQPSLTKCNTVLTFEAQSPDEVALMKAASRNGFSLIKRSIHEATLSEPLTNTRYEILDVLEFKSERKRMSVIVRSPNGIKLMTKVHRANCSISMRNAS